MPVDFAKQIHRAYHDSTASLDARTQPLPTQLRPKANAGLAIDYGKLKAFLTGQ